MAPREAELFSELIRACCEARWLISVLGTILGPGSAQHHAINRVMDLLAVAIQIPDRKTDNQTTILQIDYDDNALDVVDKVNEVLASQGIQFVNDGLPHDGFEVYTMKSNETPG